MPTIARGYDDILLDKIAAKLSAFRDREVAIDAAVNFDVDVERSRPWDTKVPLVNIITSADEYKPEGSSARRLRNGNLTISAQLWAPQSSARLRYLKAQVLAAVHAHTSPDFGEDAGSLGLGWPSYHRIEIDDTELEDDIFAGEWRWEIDYSWQPEDITGPSLDSVSVNAGLWSALYQFGGKS